jgi:hypothetical protein
LQNILESNILFIMQGLTNSSVKSTVLSETTLTAGDKTCRTTTSVGGAGATVYFPISDSICLVYTDPDGSPEQDIIWMRREGYTDSQIADHFLEYRLDSDLTVEEIGNIIFNETRSLSGDNIQEARENVAHAIINGLSTLGENRPETASTIASDAARAQDNQQYQYSHQAAIQAVLDHVTTGDPTNGSVHFNFRSNDSRANFYGATIQTQVGPLNNSYPIRDLPATGIYANTYRRP